MSYDALSIMLEIAVPGWVEKLKSHSWDYIQERAKICSAYLGEHGDDALFKSKTKGKTAEAFNRLAEGVACASFAPGGVDTFGLHFDNLLDCWGTCKCKLCGFEGISQAVEDYYTCPDCGASVKLEE